LIKLILLLTTLLRYTKREFAGGCVIVGGAIFAVLPKFINPKSSSTSPVYYAVIIYGLGFLPKGASFIYKEAAFKSALLG